jgi:acyl CoA:acetate/3-ketoacid CoA transferase beta subunit
MEQTTRSGAPRLVAQCALPVTARGVVKLVATNYGLFEPTGDGFRIREIAPGVTLDEVRATVGCKLVIPETLPTVQMLG